jgi:hypothetical protein
MTSDAFKLCLHAMHTYVCTLTFYASSALTYPPYPIATISSLMCQYLLGILHRGNFNCCLIAKWYAVATANISGTVMFQTPLIQRGFRGFEPVKSTAIFTLYVIQELS